MGEVWLAPDDPSLPPPWKGVIDGTTRVYYWNTEMNITQYEKPAYWVPPRSPDSFYHSPFTPSSDFLSHSQYPNFYPKYERPAETVINGFKFPHQFPFPNPTDMSTSQPICAHSQSVVGPIYPDFCSLQLDYAMNPSIPTFQSPSVPTFLPHLQFPSPFPSFGDGSSAAASTPSFGSTPSQPMFGSTPSQSLVGSSSSTQSSGSNSAPFGPTVSVAISGTTSSASVSASHLFGTATSFTPSTGSAMFGSSSPPPISDVPEQNEVLHSGPAVSALMDELEKLRQPLSVAVAKEVSLASLGWNLDAKCKRDDVVSPNGFDLPVLDENVTAVQLLPDLTDEDTVDENDEPAPILVDALVDNKKHDGTTYHQSPPQIGGAYWTSLRSVKFPESGVKAPLECHPLSVVRIDECLSSLDYVLIVEKDEMFSSHSPAVNSVNCLDSVQLTLHIPSATGFAPAPFVPLYVIFTTGFVNNYCQWVEMSLPRATWLEKIQRNADMDFYGNWEALKTNMVVGTLVDAFWDIKLNMHFFIKCKEPGQQCFRDAFFGPKFSMSFVTPKLLAFESSVSSVEKAMMEASHATTVLKIDFNSLSSNNEPLFVLIYNARPIVQAPQVFIQISKTEGLFHYSRVTCTLVHDYLRRITAWVTDSVLVTSTDRDSVNLLLKHAVTAIVENGHNAEFAITQLYALASFRHVICIALSLILEMERQHDKRCSKTHMLHSTQGHLILLALEPVHLRAASPWASWIRLVALPGDKNGFFTVFTSQFRDSFLLQENLYSPITCNQMVSLWSAQHCKEIDQLQTHSTIIITVVLGAISESSNSQIAAICQARSTFCIDEVIDFLQISSEFSSSSISKNTSLLMLPYFALGTTSHVFESLSMIFVNMSNHKKAALDVIFPAAIFYVAYLMPLHMHLVEKLMPPKMVEFPRHYMTKKEIATFWIWLPTPVLRLKVWVLKLHGLIVIKAQMLIGDAFLKIELMFDNESHIIPTGAIAIRLVCHFGADLHITNSYSHMDHSKMYWLHTKVILLETTYTWAFFQVAFDYGLVFVLQIVNEDFHMVCSTLWCLPLFNCDIPHVIVWSRYWRLDYISEWALMIMDKATTQSVLTMICTNVTRQSVLTMICKGAAKQSQAGKLMVRNFQGPISNWSCSKYKSETKILFLVPRVECKVDVLVILLFLYKPVHITSERSLVFSIPAFSIVPNSYASRKAPILIFLVRTSYFEELGKGISTTPVLCDEYATGHALSIPKQKTTQVLLFLTLREENHKMLDNGIILTMPTYRLLTAVLGMEEWMVEADEMIKAIQVSGMVSAAEVWAYFSIVTYSRPEDMPLFKGGGMLGLLWYNYIMSWAIVSIYLNGLSIGLGSGHLTNGYLGLVV